MLLFSELSLICFLAIASFSGDDRDRSFTYDDSRGMVVVKVAAVCRLITDRGVAGSMCPLQCGMLSDNALALEALTVL